MKFCRNFTNMLRLSRIFNFLKKRTKFFEKSVALGRERGRKKCQMVQCIFPMVHFFKIFQVFKSKIFKSIFNKQIMYPIHRSKFSQQVFLNPLRNKTSSRYQRRIYVVVFSLGFRICSSPPPAKKKKRIFEFWLYFSIFALCKIKIRS